jgi:uncharacterized protein YjbJ (UPF0337 family)
MRAIRVFVRIFAVAAIAIGLMSVTVGCQKKGPLERLGGKADNAVEKAGEAVEDAADDVKDGANDAADAVKTAFPDAPAANTPDAK